MTAQPAGDVNSSPGRRRTARPRWAVAAPPLPTERHAKRHKSLGRALLNVLLGLVAVVWLLPTLGLFVSSLRTAEANAESGWWSSLLSPKGLNFDNYAAVLGDGGIVHAFWNSVLIAVPTTVLVVILASLAGYAFAWLEFPGRDGIFLAVVAMLVVPVQIGLLPVAKLFGAVGLFGTLPGVVLFHVAYGLPFAVFLLRNYFAGVPREMLEAARIDGGSEWIIFSRLILPVAGPAIASLAIFQFLWVWNDMLVALIFADSGSQPLTVALQSQMRQFGSNIDVLAPGAFLSLVVPLVVFFGFQRYFVSGVMAGSVK
ncbi:carbohydrate ABC transporter permease [Streptomyces zaomyceticus]|uniref:carbohydrate ABC transporter permease n=1 Tax=Streptomyces zaomyceticus TaxID=68286 RepID=UPI003682E8BD